jgi:hypothetical protein
MQRASVGLVVALFARSAQADDGNVRAYLVGGRAGGMGGAFTALADDPSGPFYNPAGIAHVSRSQVSLSASLFGVLSGSIDEALGRDADLTYQNVQTFPIQTSGIYKLGPEPAQQSRHALAISVFVPNSTFIDDRADIARTDNAVFYSNQDNTVWAGATYARRFGDVELGVSAYGLLETHISELDLSVLNPVDASRFANVFSRRDELKVGVVGALGMRWDVSRELSLGVSVFSPAFGVYDQRKEYVRLLAGPGDGIPTSVAVSADDLHSAPTLPLRLQGGIAWTSGSITLAGDVMVLASREVRNDSDRAFEGLDLWIKRNTVVNAAAGVELLLTPTLPVRAGLWTDFSAADAPTPDGPDNTTTLDRIGASMSLGLRGEHTESSLNLNAAYAFGHSLVPNELDFSRLETTDEYQLGLYTVLATSFQF